MIKGLIKEKVDQAKAAATQTIQDLELRVAEINVNAARLRYGEFQHNILSKVPGFGSTVHASLEKSLNLAHKHLEEVRSRQSKP